MFLGICSAEYQREDPKNPHYSPTLPHPTRPHAPFPSLPPTSQVRLHTATATPHPIQPHPRMRSLSLSISSHLTSTKQNNTKQNKTKQNNVSCMLKKLQKRCNVTHRSSLIVQFVSTGLGSYLFQLSVFQSENHGIC